MCFHFQNATDGDSEKHEAVLVLIEELRLILLDVSLTYAQKMAKIHAHFEVFFEVHVEWKEFFLKIEIEGFGSLESFIDVTLGVSPFISLSKIFYWRPHFPPFRIIGDSIFKFLFFSTNAR